MSRPLPPLTALRAFEATARNLSFTRAAAELAVTPAALSHQIRGLEEILQTTLFHRKVRAIELTDDGHMLFPGLRTAFEGIRAAVDRLDRGASGRVLVVSATPGLTAKWLVPRLYRFMEANPGIDARISATMDYSNFTTDGVDVAIRMSPGIHPGLRVEKLLEEAVLPLCAPRLMEGPGGLRGPADLARFTLIHYSLPTQQPGAIPTWDDWLRAAGVTGVDANKGIRLNMVDHMLDAAVEGAGVALAYRTIASGDIRAGRLVNPFGPVLPIVGRAYHLVYPPAHEQRAKVRAFRDWVLAEARATQQPGQTRV